MTSAVSGDQGNENHRNLLDSRYLFDDDPLELREKDCASAE